MAQGASAQPQPRTTARSRLAKLGIFIAGGIIAPLLAIGVATSVHWADRKFNPPPDPLPEQLQAEFELAAQNGLNVVFNEAIDLRGTGNPSRVVVLQPAFTPKTLYNSDELRIYDVVNGELEQNFTFRPTSSTPGAPTNLTFRYALTPLLTEDFDENGTSEIIAPAFQEFADSRIARPFLIRWSPGEDSYVANAVLGVPNESDGFSYGPPNRPNLIHPKPNTFAAGARALYLHPVEVTNTSNDVSQASYATHDFIIRKNRFGRAVLIGGFLVGAEMNASPHWKIQLGGWSLTVNTKPGAPSGVECFAPASESAVTTRLRGGETIPIALARTARKVTSSYC
jgi:hypothetical protein